MTATPDNHPALTVNGLSKSFPGVLALDRVSVEVGSGEVHALLGQNGCGKSTLIKVLAGYHQPDPGAAATVDGEDFELGSSESAERAGLRFVHQDLGIVDELSAVDNVALSLGYTRTRIGTIDWSAQRRKTAELMEEFGVGHHVETPLAQASAVERTVVAIARALAGWQRGRGLLVLDEPTAALSNNEVQRLFDVVRMVKESGTAVLYVSHRLDDVFEIADRVTVLRTGQVVLTGEVGDSTRRGLAAAIAGQEIDEAAASTAARVAGSAPVLAVRGLRTRTLRGVDFEVGAGEMVGIAGLLGSGREDIGHALAGAYSGPISGEWTIGDRVHHHLDPSTAISEGIGFAPPDRARESAILEMSVLENMSLAALPSLRRRWGLDHRDERRLAREYLEKLGIPPERLELPIRTLSGGNQQKVIVAKWLWSRSHALVLAEPTAGLDPGARHALYHLLLEQQRQGTAIVMASSDVEDLTSVCGRVLVMREGAVAAELVGAEIEASRIIAVMEAVDD